MRMTNALIPTLRDVPADAAVPSHQLLLKGGYILRTAAGLYNYLPLGHRVLAKVEAIVREEMDRFGGQEVLMPILQPAELWEESGRWEVYGEELMRIKDRHDRQFCLGPTHEEVITDLVRQTIGSYKALPLRLYQMQNKYRDERRPRFGLMRGREFVMKDLYSFDLDEAGLDAAYEDMYQAYTNVFNRCGLTFRPVLADAGQIGGGYTHEFNVLAENGESVLAICPDCDYAANQEIAEVKASPVTYPADEAALEKVHTPDAKTIDAVAAFLQVDEKQCAKTMMFEADGDLICVLTLGNDEVNEVKIQKIHPCDQLVLADQATIRARLGADPGSLGPVGIPEDIPIYADQALKGGQGLVVGANENDYHYTHVNLDRDAKIAAYGDLRMVVEGDACPVCGAQLTFTRGIEVGQIFKLGTKYSEAMGATVLDENGKARPLIMGCYGIGVSRTVAAAVEQHHDGRGIIWPKSLAPYQVHLIAVNMKDESLAAIAEKTYQALIEAGLEVLFDDRKERAGVKFNDADLIGIPLQLIIGKGAVENGEIEWKDRRTGEKQMVQPTALIQAVKAFYDYE
ncbi:proline--tRNA ligase [Peptococcus simiae]|uniref:proline--tRNA ligase n=1 Tax=Peptococcus simiae TaxID=1643805 RepID=UPI0039814ACF